MKTILIIVCICSIAGLIFLAACGRLGKRGSGHVTTDNRVVSPFTKVSIEGIFPVELSQDGGSEWVKVETDDNLQQMIVVKNIGDEVRIEMADNKTIRKSTKMKVYVNVKDLKQLDFNSVGNVSSAGTLKLDSLEVNSESVGKLNLSLDAGYLKANLKSIGSTTFEGKAREVRINNKSVGSLNAFDLKAGTLMIHNTAVGTAEVYADSAFYIRSSAIGTLYYKGPGVVKELSAKGIGKVQKED
jgi:hypothetical protein